MKKLLPLVAIFFLFMSSTSYAQEKKFLNDYNLLGWFKPNPHKWIKKAKLIAHGFGRVGKTTSTNSLEAFEYNYAQGYRVFEADLILTSDNHLVARHDWHSHLGHYFKQKIPKSKRNKPLTHKEFMALPIDKKYTPLDFEGIAKLLKKHKDAYLITDTKERDKAKIKKQFSIIVKTAKKVDPEILNRIIPQIYNEEMLRHIRKVYDFKSVIYTLYQSKATDDQVIDFASKNGIKAITMYTKRYSPAFVRKLKEKGIYSFVHPVNTVHEMRLYEETGVMGFYSDIVLPKQLKKRGFFLFH